MVLLQNHGQLCEMNFEGDCSLVSSLTDIVTCILFELCGACWGDDGRVYPVCIWFENKEKGICKCGLSCFVYLLICSAMSLSFSSLSVIHTHTHTITCIITECSLSLSLSLSLTHTHTLSCITTECALSLSPSLSLSLSVIHTCILTCITTVHWRIKLTLLRFHLTLKLYLCRLFINLYKSCSLIFKLSAVLENRNIPHASVCEDQGQKHSTCKSVRIKDTNILHASLSGSRTNIPHASLSGSRTETFHMQVCPDQGQTFHMQVCPDQGQTFHMQVCPDQGQTFHMQVCQDQGHKHSTCKSLSVSKYRNIQHSSLFQSTGTFNIQVCFKVQEHSKCKSLRIKVQERSTFKSLFSMLGMTDASIRC